VERRVEEHDLASGLVAPTLELLEARDEHLRGDPAGRSRDAPAQPEHRQVESARLASHRVI
jgi:hypothetical protein